MKTTKKVIQILLPLVLLLAVLASCGVKEDIPWQKTTAKTTATTAGAEDGTSSSSSANAESTATTTTPLPPPSFNGDGFSIVSVGSRSRENKLEFYNLDGEESALAKELSEAYLELENRLDTRLGFFLTDYEDALADLSANRFAYDAIYTQQVYWAPLAINGYIQPLNTEEIRSAGFDVEDPDTVDIYLTGATKELDGENVWAASFSGKYFAQYWMSGLRFNKDIVAAVGYPAETLYQLVRDGQWTWDKLEEICRAVMANTDNDGLGVDSGVVEHIFNGMGIAPTRGTDGKWRAPSLEEVLRGADYALKWTGGAGEISFRLSSASSSGISSEFERGKMAFAFTSADYLYVYNKVYPEGHGFPVGYLPSPKFAGNDAPAYTSLDINGICIPTENSELRRTAYALGEIAKIVNSAEGAREFMGGILPDEESVEMVMDYIIPGTVFARGSLSIPVNKVASRFRHELFDIHSDIGGGLYDRDTVAQNYVTNVQAEIDKLFGY